MGWVVITSYDKFGCYWQLLCSQAECLFGYLEAYTIYLEDNAAGLQGYYESFRSTFTLTHTYIQRLLRDRLVREYADPYLTLTLHMASYCDTSCFDLATGQPDGTKTLDTERAKYQLLAAMSHTLDATLLTAAEFCFLWL